MLCAIYFIFLRSVFNAYTRVPGGACFCVFAYYHDLFCSFRSVWLVESVWHGRPECFLFERLFQLFEDLSRRLTEPLCAAGRAAVCRPCRAAFFCVCDFFACFVVPDVLRTAVTLVCWSGGFFFDFELPIRQIER